ncbi:MAG: hypothetical protein ACRCWF_17785 [Beijerinckiaceae bacterium]
MKPASKLIINGLAAAAALGFGLFASPDAQAQGSNCQADFQKMMGPRQTLIGRINGYRNKRPTADQACSTLSQLVAADSRVIKWMTENKDWCQIPDELVGQLKASSGQASASRNQACGAAKKQRAMIAQARAAQARAAQQQGGGGGGPPAVGSGVRLPQGAL